MSKNIELQKVETAFKKYPERTARFDKRRKNLCRKNSINSRWNLTG